MVPATVDAPIDTHVATMAPMVVILALIGALTSKKKVNGFSKSNI